jgi:aminomethyltransferase
MAESSETIKTTPLHAAHHDLEARMMEFGGFEMPVQYSGIIDEHMAVRNHAGLFDVSHMGEVLVEGEAAFDFVQHLITNDAGTLTDGQALYTVMCTPDGGVVDDLLVYRRAANRYLLVINAANRASDFAWMQEHNPMGARLTDAGDEIALLALQGPKSLEIAQPFTAFDLEEISFYHFREAGGAFMECESAIVSRTGYTGELGLELYVPADDAERVWTTLLDAGASHGLKPAGLGARDTLRLEAGLCLYGNDLTRETNPYEAGLGWVVKPEASDFVGRSALVQIRDRGPERSLIGFVAAERGIPRHDHVIESADGEEIGVVTSGSQSPILDTGIGLGYVPNDDRYTEPGTDLRVASRRRTFSVTVHEPPFHKK